MQNGKVSIIIPFKNTAHYLPECLDSIVNQSYTDWEVLAVNDNSTDESYELLTSYSNKDERIKVFQNKGSGIIPALQTGYAKSNGAFVTRMDSDDIMRPNRLEVMVNSLHETGPGYIAVGQVKYFSDRGIRNG